MSGPDPGPDRPNFFWSGQTPGVFEFVFPLLSTTGMTYEYAGARTPNVIFSFFCFFPLFFFPFFSFFSLFLFFFLFQSLPPLTRAREWLQTPIQQQHTPIQQQQYNPLARDASGPPLYGSFDEAVQVPSPRPSLVPSLSRLELDRRLVLRQR